MLSLDRRGRMICGTDEILPPELRPYYDENRRRFSFPVCGDIARRILRGHPDMEISTELSEEFERITYAQEKAICISSLDDIDGDERLYPYQRVGVAWLKAVGKGILADEQGLGKTVLAVVAARECNPGRCLIICKTSAMVVWADHVAEWIPDRNRFMLDGDPAFRREVVEQWRDRGGFLVSNFERAELHAGELAGADLVIIDEAHKIRNRKTDVSSAVRKIAHRAERLFILTASPTVNNLTDMWALLNMCDRQRFGSFWGFAFRFCSISDTGYGLKILGIRDGEQENVDRILRPYVLRRMGMLGLNPSEYRVENYLLFGEQRRLYTEMAKTGTCRLGEHVVETVDVLAQITRLRQIALDPALIFGHRVYDGPSKLDLLRDIILQEDGQVVVFTNYAQLAHRAVERLVKAGISATAMTGDLSAKQREYSTGLFRSGDARVIVCTHGTGGESLTLTEANRAIFLDLAWHPAGNEHAAKRINRHGQKSDKTQVIILHAPKTVEDHVMAIIAEKRPVTIGEILSRGLLPDWENNRV